MIKNWQHLCIFGRLLPQDIKKNDITIHHNSKDITVHQDGDGNLEYIDNDTGEVLLIQGEDGFPTYSSEWAEQYPTAPYQIA